jgi:hypothetical protein
MFMLGAFYLVCDDVCQNESVARVAVVYWIGEVSDMDGSINPETTITTEVMVGMMKDIR